MLKVKTFRCVNAHLADAAEQLSREVQEVIDSGKATAFTTIGSSFTQMSNDWWQLVAVICFTMPKPEKPLWWKYMLKLNSQGRAYVAHLTLVDGTELPDQSVHVRPGVDTLEVSPQAEQGPTRVLGPEEVTTCRVEVLD